MTIEQAIESRRTLRDFMDRPVPQEIVRAALEAGLKAPSYNHQKEWDFLLVHDALLRRALIQAGRLGGAAVTRDDLPGLEPLAQDMYLDAIPKQGRMILSAPQLLVVVYKPKTQIAQSQRPSDLNSLAAVWCCIQNILLELAAHGVFGTTMVPDHTAGIKEVLGIPQQLEVAVLLPFGYKAPHAHIIAQKDVPLDAKLHINRW